MKKIKLDQLPKNATAQDVTEASAAASAAGGAKSFGKWWKLLLAVVCAVYMFVPEITDALPVIGWLDEVVAGAVSVISFVSALKTGRYDPNTRMEQRAKDIFGDKD